MPNYDFTAALSPIDFELLSKDLLEAELGIRFENFREGRDRGIDLRYAPAQRSSTLKSAVLSPLREDPEQTWGCGRRFVTMSGQAEYPVNYGGHSHAIRCLGGNDDSRPVCRSAACGGG